MQIEIKKWVNIADEQKITKIIWKLYKNCNIVLFYDLFELSYVGKVSHRKN